MAYVTNHDVQILWSQAADKTWPGLYRALQENSNNEDLQMSFADVNNVMRATSRLNNQGVPFPGTPIELTEVINQEIGG